MTKSAEGLPTLVWWRREPIVGQKLENLTGLPGPGQSGPDRETRATVNYY
jgi:hypothetical protein